MHSTSNIKEANNEPSWCAIISFPQQNVIDFRSYFPRAMKSFQAFVGGHLIIETWSLLLMPLKGILSCEDLFSHFRFPRNIRVSMETKKLTKIFHFGPFFVDLNDLPSVFPPSRRRWWTLNNSSQNAFNLRLLLVRIPCLLLKIMT